MAISDCLCRFLLEYKIAEKRIIIPTPMITPTLIPPMAPLLNPEEPELVADDGIGVRMPPVCVVLELGVDKGDVATEAFNDGEEVDDGLREYADKSFGGGA